MSQVEFVKPDSDIDSYIPVLPVGWRVLIRPYKPKSTYGDTEIQISDGALESEEYLTYVGQIVAMGSECYKAVTRSGIELANIEPKPQVGDWVIYGTYGGQKVETKAGVKYLLMNDDGIMGIVNDPAEFRAYL